MNPINKLHACALEMAGWGELRRVFPTFSVQMHDEIISRLLYSELMRVGWEKLGSATKLENRYMRVAHGFLHTSLDAYMAYAAAKVRPISEHRNHYYELASSINALIEAISQDPDFGYGLSGHALGQVSRQDQRMREQLTAFAMRKGVSQDIASEIADAGEVFAIQYGETLGEMLRGLAHQADSIAKAGPLSLHPNRKDSHEHYFVRRTTRWMLHEFKRPLYMVSACAANALFASDMDPNHVQKLVRRNWK